MFKKIVLVITVSIVVSFVFIFSCNTDLVMPLNQSPEAEDKIDYRPANKLNLTLNQFAVKVNDIKVVARNFMLEEVFMNKNVRRKSEFSSNQNVTKLMTERRNIENANIAVQDVVTIHDSANRPIAYIVNLMPTGYCVLAATLKIKPVLCFSDSGRFLLENLRDNENEKFWWVMKFREIVDLMNDTNYRLPADVTAEWLQYGIADTIITFNSHLQNDPNQRYSKIVNVPNVVIPPGCILEQYEAWFSVNRGVVQIDTNINIGPLMGTQWGQGNDYNNACPHKDCSRYTNGRAPAGCVAVAVGQIMKFWFRNLTNRVIRKNHIGHGSESFNFANMPDYINSYDQTNQAHVELNYFLRHIGLGVAMVYTCQGSGSNASMAEGIFQANYFNTNLRSYDFNVVVNEITNNRPVYIRADPSYACFLNIEGGICWGTGTGHAWVVEGFRQITHTVHIYNYSEIVPIIDCTGERLMVKNNNTYSNDKPKQTTESFSTYVSTTTKYLKHNWGWAGYSNGWYVEDDFQVVGVNNYRHFKKIITVRY